MRVTIDLMKKSTQIIDLSNVVNPRVGDDDLQLPLHIGYGDSLVDMRGKDVEFLSQDTNKNNIYIAGTVNTNTPGDNLFMGDLTFRFPAGTFKTDGTYDPDNTMFRIVDKETQKVISSVNVKITVMKNNIEFNFDPDKTSYDSRLETMLNDFHDKGQTMLDEIENLNNQAKSNVSGDTAATANEAKQQANANAGDISDLKGEVTGARGRFTNMADREDAQDTAINQKESIINANANYTALQQKDAQQDAALNQKAGKFELEDKLSQMDLQPEGFENEAALKTKYPNGKSGIMVTVDTGHKWLWVNGAWEDCGVYQNAGIGDKYITNRMIADNTIQDNVINTIHLSSIQDSYANIGEATSWGSESTDQSVSIGKDHNVAWIKKSNENINEGILFPVRLPFIPTGGEAVYVDFYYQTIDANGSEDEVSIWITQSDGALIKNLFGGGKKNEGYGKIKLSASDFATNNYPQNFSILVSVHGGPLTLKANVRVSYNPDNIEQPIRNYQLGNLISTNHPHTGLWDPESWIDASKIRSSNEDLLSKAIIWEGRQSDALSYNNGELVKTAGDISYASGISFLVDADTSTDQYIKIIFGYHGLAAGSGVSAFLGDESLNLKTKLGGPNAGDAAGVITAHIEPQEFANYGISNNKFTIIIGGEASAIYVKEIKVSTLPIGKTLPNALAHLHNYVGEPDENFYGQNVNSFDTATKATIDGLTLGTSGTGYASDDGRLKAIQAYVPEQKAYSFIVGKIDQNNLLVSGRTFELPLGKGFNDADMTGYNIQVNNGEMLFMDLSEAGVYTPDGNHPKYLNTKLRDGNHPSTKVGYTGQTFYDADYLVPFSYSVAAKNLQQQISTLKDKLAETNNQSAKGNANKLDVITSPNGKTFRLVVGDDGSLSAVSTLPNNVVIFGNSLTSERGGIGMAASDSNHDWYHYVTDYIKGKNTNVKINDRTNMSIWSTATSTADREKIFNDSIKPLLSTDTDLVIIQLGDNINTAEEKATLANDAGELLQQIHAVSPKALIYWIYGWFGGDYETIIQNACDNNGATGIDVNDLYTAENQSKLGATRQGINGETWQITIPGEAIHPGDKGMKAIADRVISNFDF